MTATYSNSIKEGDVIIIYANYKQMYSIIVERGKSFQSKFGSLNHDNLIGLRFGTKVSCSKGYVYALGPTAELRAATSLHRTQILYPHDVALALCQLHVRPGTVLLEAGTGSGSFSRAAARLLAPDGCLHTFEVNNERYRSAAIELADCVDVVRFYNRNVCVDGFGISDTADAVFLDLPAPWEVVEHCVNAFKRTSTCRFGSFSPCIEQTQKTCDRLRQSGFTEIEVVECVPRQLKVVELCSTGSVGKGVSVKQGSAAHKRSRISNADAADRNESVPKQDLENAFSEQAANNDSCAPSLSFVADPNEQPTHTGYLTFATFLPRVF